MTFVSDKCSKKVAASGVCQHFDCQTASDLSPDLSKTQKVIDVVTIVITDVIGVRMAFRH
jgi:hypothetical protein